MIFYSNRKDGLGERLKAMLNAMALSKACGGTFSFDWPRHPTNDKQADVVLPINAMFSADFIAKYALTNVAHDEKSLVKLSECSDRLFEDRASFSQTDLILVSQQDLRAQAKALMSDLNDRIDYVETFKEIQFSEKLELARQAALEIQFDSDLVAVHLRAGDIVYGKYRVTDRFGGKVVPYPVVEKIVANALEKNSKVIIFGQDDQSIAALQHKFGIMSAIDLLQPFDFCDAQKAIFEFCLMSRCKTIFAGSSGFAGLAAKMGGIRVQATRNVFSNEEIVTIITEFISRRPIEKSVPSLQRSFACRIACVQAGQNIPTKEPFIGLMNEALKLDPENDFYRLVTACSLYSQDQIDAAERTILPMLQTDNRSKRTIAYVLTSQRSKGVLFASGCQKAIADMADRGFPMASLCAGISQKAFGQFAQAKHHAQIARQNCPTEWKQVVENAIVQFRLD